MTDDCCVFWLVLMGLIIIHVGIKDALFIITSHDNQFPPHTIATELWLMNPNVVHVYNIIVTTDH